MISDIRRPLLLLAGACVAVFASADSAQAQDLDPSRRLSPIGIAKTQLDDTYVKVTYGRPYVRNRVIFGEPSDSAPPLVPYGEIWRTGANEATELTTTGRLLISGEPLEPGTYAVFTEPGPSRWIIHFSPQLGLDGTARMSPDGEFTPDVYDPARDVLMVEAPSSELEDTVQQFTLEFEPNATGADLVLRWETTEVRVPLAVP